jgi:hypothetical protein
MMDTSTGSLSSKTATGRTMAMTNDSIKTTRLELETELEMWVLEEFRLRCKERHIDFDQAINHLVKRAVQEYKEELERLR